MRNGLGCFLQGLVQFGNLPLTTHAFLYSHACLQFHSCHAAGAPELHAPANGPPCRVCALIGILRARSASGPLGKVTVSRPFSKWASALSSSTPRGSASRRSNRP